MGEGDVQTLVVTKATKIVVRGKIHDGDSGTVRIQAAPIVPSLLAPVTVLTDLG